MIFSIDFYSTKRNTFILKCFIQFTCSNLDDCQKEEGNFFNLFQKEGDIQKGVGVGGLGGSLRKGGVPKLEETMTCGRLQCLSSCQKYTSSFTSFLRYYILKNPVIWLADSILAYNLRLGILPDMGLLVKHQ